MTVLEALHLTLVALTLTLGLGLVGFVACLIGVVLWRLVRDVGRKEGE